MGLTKQCGERASEYYARVHGLGVATCSKCIQKTLDTTIERQYYVCKSGEQAPVCPDDMEDKHDYYQDTSNGIKTRGGSLGCDQMCMKEVGKGKWNDVQKCCCNDGEGKCGLSNMLACDDKHWGDKLN